jgi:uncharacterized protein DUF4440
MGRYLDCYNHENYKRPMRALQYRTLLRFMPASLILDRSHRWQVMSTRPEDRSGRERTPLSVCPLLSPLLRLSQNRWSRCAPRNARLHALVHGDLVVADQLHAEDFQLISPSGDVVSKEQYLSAIASEEIIYRVWEPDSPIAVRPHDSVALIRYRSRLDGIAGEQVIGLRRYWHTDVYERRKGRWQCVWSQATEIQ